MKPYFFAVGLFVLAFSARGDDALGSSQQWILPENAYGQFRMVPSKVEKNLTEEREWDGLWEPYRDFVLRVGYASGRQMQPGNFDFVEPRVSIEGTKAGTRSASSTTVPLFDRASAPKDIQITFRDLPQALELDREYKAATIWGESALCTWDVFVKFSRAKPAYVRDKDTAGAR